MDETLEKLEEKEKELREGMSAMEETMEEFGLSISPSQINRTKRKLIWEWAEERYEELESK